MTSNDSPQVLGKYARAVRAPRGLRAALKLGELERAISRVDEWRAMRAQIDGEEWATVAGLRHKGASWDSIGWLLGVTGDAVRQRFGKSLGEDLCPCGKPRAHLAADPDSAEWACRVPDPHV